MASTDVAVVVTDAVAFDPVASRHAVAVPMALIDATDRLREVSEPHAQVLAVSMAERGQRQPIEIVRRGAGYRLVFGAHRYRGAEINEWATIDAFIVEGTDVELRLREIDENLIRHELTALDRARFLLERKRLYEALNPGTGRGGDRRSDQSAKLAVWSFSQDIAEKTGLSERTIQRACELASKLSPDVVAMVRHTPWASNQAALQTLAKHPASRQAHAVRMMLATANPAKSVNEAFDRIDGRVVKPAGEKHYAKAVDLWGRMSAKDRKLFLTFLAGSDLPKGCTVEVAS